MTELGLEIDAYPIVDVDTLLSHGLSPLGFATELLSVKPRLLQVRAKHMPAREYLLLLKALAPQCRRAETLLFANDRPDLALLAECDGIHVGQTDLSVEDVRRIGPRLAVGVSTHNLDQLHRALASRPDYVALGPLWPTSSKKNPDPTVAAADVERASALADAQGVPLVGIGGIDLDRARTLAALGIGAALISALVPRSPGQTPAQLLARFQALYRL